MDYLLLAICAFYSIKGFVRGFVKMLLSFVGVFLIAIISFKIASNIENLFGLRDCFQNLFTNLLNGLASGTFSSKEELMTTLESLSGNLVLISILKLLVSSISIQGELTLGGVFSPILSNIAYRLVVFLIVFILILFLTRIIGYLLNFAIKKTGLSPVNRFLGLFLGFLKGLLISSIVFIILSTLASFNLSEGLTSFVNSGYVSNYIYENHIIKLFEGVYSIFS